MNFPPGVRHNGLMSFGSHAHANPSHMQAASES